MKEGWREGGSGCVCEREMETGCVCLCVREVDMHSSVRIVRMTMKEGTPRFIKLVCRRSFIRKQIDVLVDEAHPESSLLSPTLVTLHCTSVCRSARRWNREVEHCSESRRGLVELCAS